MNQGEIIIYQTPSGETELNVNVSNDTVWLTQKQIAMLFGTKRPAITKHLKNIFASGELDEESTCSILEHIGENALRPRYQTILYNLDAILSVGYRVKSQRGTQFRIWANRVLKEYLLKGYAINQNAKAEQLEELKSAVKLLANVLEQKELSADEASGLLKVITDFTYALDTLDRYDYQKLEITDTTRKEDFHATYENAIKAIGELRDKFGSGGLFAHEKDGSFRSSIATIYQTFDGVELYPSVEEKAAMLLYLVVKNHSFSDGNKRIAAFLFLWFLSGNGILYKPNGSPLIGNNTLVALTLMIAESRPDEMEVMIKVVVNLINKQN
ncbi:MAG: virulence protein RhuM/Fic/DOC family protein [Rikenellaceae bacterium]|jgi:prophage maintenance system killer protein|nr:virulence protein RhuM/Fic/DOC family protein [Rikenellaceae bacterium]